MRRPHYSLLLSWLSCWSSRLCGGASTTSAPERPSWRRRYLQQPNHEPPSAAYYTSVAVAGAVSCSVTHAAVVPIDVIKTRMQTDSSLCGPRDAIRSIVSCGCNHDRCSFIQRAKPFLNGVGATAVGYFAQGAFKFGAHQPAANEHAHHRNHAPQLTPSVAAAGGYEFFKRSALHGLNEQGEAGQAFARHFRLPIMIGSAAAAEIVASAALCPLEVLKLKMQTTPTLASLGLQRALLHLVRTEGVRALFQGFAPIAMRQVPYTACKLVTFELGHNLLRSAVCRHELRQLARSSASSGASCDCSASDRHRMPIVMTAGMSAGAAAACVSQPFDLLLTRLCGGSSAGVANLADCVIAEGFREQLLYLVSLGPAAFTGLAPRLAMVSFMTAAQFVVYDSLRLALRCPAPHAPPRPPAQVPS